MFIYFIQWGIKVKTLVLVNGKMQVINIPIPNYGDNEVLVKNMYSAVSAGSEIKAVEKSNAGLVKSLREKVSVKDGISHIKTYGITKTLKEIKKEKKRITTSKSMGYSSCGKVIKIGRNITDISLGDMVACGGAEVATHSEYVVVPRNLLVKIPEDICLKYASFATIGSIVLQAIRRAEVEIGSRVAIIGLGLLGQIACQILSNSGCNVIGIDIDEERVKLANKLGLKCGFVSNNRLVEKIQAHTNNVGVDCVILFASTSSSKPINDAMQMCRKKGKIVIVGFIGMDLERADFYKKELDIVMSTAYGPGRYDRQYEEKGIDYPIAYVRWTANRNMEEFLRLIKNKKIDLDFLIDKTFSLNDAQEAYQQLKDKEIIGAVFKYSDDESSLSKTYRLRRFQSKKGINVGLIGCGRFVKKVHLPNILNISDYHLCGVQSKSGLNAKETAERFNADYYTTDYEKILEDDNIDLIFITTTHNLHASLVLKSIKAGKHVFVEKPLCINEHDLEKIEREISKSNTSLCVGWNRRFAPSIQFAKRYIQNNDLLKKGLIINFRINSGFSKTDSIWMFDNEVSGGCIVGECCHWFDLMNYFMESKPRMISAYSLDSNNIVSNIKYANGSIGSVTYSIIGNNRYPKERLDIFGNNVVIYIDNYKSTLIEGYKTINKKYLRVDKGHYALIENYAKFLRGEYEGNDLPINQTAIDSMKLTFEIAKTLYNRGEKENE